jgi:hypothetical protein
MDSGSGNGQFEVQKAPTLLEVIMGIRRFSDAL